jgi:hypothetical protein
VQQGWPPTHDSRCPGGTNLQTAGAVRDRALWKSRRNLMIEDVPESTPLNGFARRMYKGPKSLGEKWSAKHQTNKPVDVMRCPSPPDESPFCGSQRDLVTYFLEMQVTLAKSVPSLFGDDVEKYLTRSAHVIGKWAGSHWRTKGASGCRARGNGCRSTGRRI